MLVIVRVSVQTEFKSGPTIHYTSENQNKFWDYVIDNQPNWENDGVQILYLTHRHMKNDVSLIIRTRTSEDLSKYLLEKLSPIDYIEGFWIINLFEPRFFLPPEKGAKQLSRFTLNISANPMYYKSIYQTISQLLPNNDFMISYIAYTFHKFKSDIIVSIVCEGLSTLNEIVNKYIKTIEGINNIEITRITKTQRLASIEEWRSFAGSLYIPSEGLIIDEQSTFEEDVISGC
jgi:hypothetical protein